MTTAFYYIAACAIALGAWAQPAFAATADSTATKPPRPTFARTPT